MKISNASPNAQAIAAPPTRPASRDDNTRPTVRPPSSVVELSDEAKKLDAQRNPQQAAEAKATAQRQTESQSSKSPGIEFVTGASKGGKVNTFA